MSGSLKKIDSTKSKKEEVIVLMSSLARHFRVPDGELTAEYMNDYWIGLMDYPIEQIAAGFKWLKENQESSWFPSIRLIIKAIRKMAPQSNQPGLPAPVYEPTDEERLRNKLNGEWWRMYFGSAIFDPTLIIKQPESGLRKRNKPIRELTKAEKVQYAAYLQEDSDYGRPDIVNQKRVAYVAMRMNDMDVSQGHKEVSI